MPSRRSITSVHSRLIAAVLLGLLCALALDRWLVPPVAAQAPPTITSLTPDQGPESGGNVVFVEGTNLSSGMATVTFGSTPTSASCFGSQCNAVAPPGTGTVQVTVTTAAGTSNQLPYTYVADSTLPTVIAIDPDHGPAAGGDVVSIFGSNFSTTPGATAVAFGAAPGFDVLCYNSAFCIASAPPGTGTVSVRVTVGGQTSADTPADDYTYDPGLPAPTVTAITPSSGPATGGTVVMITGTNLTGATAVFFGSPSAPSFTVDSATQITAIAPPGTGTVRVRVRVGGQISAGTPASEYTYTGGPPAPTIIAITPGYGPAAGGAPVTITGANFSTTLGETGFGAQLGSSGSFVPAFTDVDCTSTSQCQAVSIFSGVPDSLAIALPIHAAVTSAGIGPVNPTATFAWYGRPALTSISPTSGSAAGGTSVTLAGTAFPNTADAGFQAPVTVMFGSTPIQLLSGCTTYTTCTVTAPSGTGTVQVTITTPGGVSDAQSFTYTTPPPTVTGLSPTQGPAAGGTVVTITGTGFTGATAVTFGATPATTFTVNSDTQITATAPAASGVVSVRVTTPGGTSADTAADDYTYVSTPTVTGLMPASGSAAGGTAVTITGTNFSTMSGATTVAFGSTAATGVSCSPMQCVATSPAGSGTVSVRVTVSGQTSADTPADDFTYIPPPTVTAISPSTGPAVGGTVVTITGTGFSLAGGATAITFGATAATGITCASTMSCTATSPAGSGIVSVRATVAGQTSADTAADDFTYVPPPAVTNLSPAQGPAAGGTVVTITGTNLTSPLGPTTVAFGSTAATNVSCASATSCTAASPAGSGMVSVRVTAGGQQSADTAADDFTYIPPPAVTSLTPPAGLTGGGGTVTITGTNLSNPLGPTTVTFGSTSATNVICAGATSCTVTAPPGTGTVDVRVTVLGQQSANSAADNYTYVVPDATAMTVTGTAIVNGASAPAGAVIQAFVGGLLCGQGNAGGGGAFTLLVVRAAQIPGCGTPGAAVSFTIGGQPASAQPPVLFQQSGLAKITLVVGGPPPPLAPMSVSGTVTQNGVPLSKVTVQAVVGGTVCGSAISQSGAFALSVAANPPQAGCGTPGATVTFTVNGVAATGTVTFTPGGTGMVALTVP